jgi:hypothetical protein
MQQRITVCQHLNKPSFVGESGICADITATGDCSGSVTTTTLNQRATFFEAKLRAGLNTRLAGYILWNKGDESIQDDIGPGDPTESVLTKYAFMSIVRSQIPQVAFAFFAQSLIKQQIRPTLARAAAAPGWLCRSL